MRNQNFLKLLSTLMLLLASSPIFAHIKWFSKYSYGDEPLQMADVTNPVFWVLAISSMIVVGFLTVVDKKMHLATWYANATAWLSNYKDKSVLILRIAAGVVLLMSWKLGTLIMPELAIECGLLTWFQFLLAVFLLFRVTVPLAGAGMVILYTVAINRFGLFHMLDYLLIPGIAYFFISSNSKNFKFKNTGLLVLYISLGFSLCWAGMEKLIYPQWGTYLLELHPQLALGLDSNLFIQGAAFIEISVGVMFIFGFFHRILAITVTLLFFLTTLVFGETEVTGHLMIHAALVIFLIEGSGDIFKTAPPFYRQIGRNPVLASAGFAILLFALIVPYTYGANVKYNEALQTQSEEHLHSLEISDPELAPQLAIQLNEDDQEGWNIQLETQNFKFETPKKGEDPFQNNGYAVLLINDVLTARIYSDSYYLPPMEAGNYMIEVGLRSLDHQPLTHFGMPIKANYEIIVE